MFRPENLKGVLNRGVGTFDEKSKGNLTRQKEQSNDKKRLSKHTVQGNMCGEKKPSSRPKKRITDCNPNYTPLLKTEYGKCSKIGGDDI